MYETIRRHCEGLLSVSMGDDVCRIFDFDQAQLVANCMKEKNLERHSRSLSNFVDSLVKKMIPLLKDKNPSYILPCFLPNPSIHQFIESLRSIPSRSEGILTSKKSLLSPNESMLREDVANARKEALRKAALYMQTCLS